MSNTLREEITKHVLSYYDNDASRDKAVEKLSLLIEDVAVKFVVWMDGEYWQDLPEELVYQSTHKEIFNHWINNIYNGATTH